MSLKIGLKVKKTHNVNLIYKASENIPKYVYGDGVRVKQFLLGIINNSIKHIKKGFIGIEINTIIRYDMCGFLIDISTTDGGISVDKINEIMSLSETNDSIDDLTDNLKFLKILINKLGENFLIKTDKGITTINITLDQRICNEQENKTQKKINSYEDKIIKSKKVLVIDDDLDELNKISLVLEQKNMIVSNLVNSDAIFYDIQNKKNYDYIIINDDLCNTTAYNIFKKLNKIDGVNIPIIIMLNNSKYL